MTRIQNKKEEDMDERVIELMVGWNKQQGQLKKFAESGLEFSYKFGGKQMEEKRAQIIEALAFWKFISDFAGWWLGWETRRSFLAHFTAHSNPMIRVVAMAESLPTSVWRKILWKHNIDFMSFESFLRRLEEKQIEAIKQNYEDLFAAEEVPRVFSRAERFLRGINVEKLLNEDFNGDRRYSRKAAMSFNLLNLDFGFNAYPKGVKDDTKVEEISPLKFLSVKNHADDFVVNKEDGKYWWLYRRARSNYVWRPNREVKIKTHICPGFWYTLLVHLIFWALSPLAGIAFSGMTARGLSSVNWWIAGPIGVAGLITPLWLLLAGSKLLFEMFIEVFAALVNLVITKQVDERVSEWLTRNKSIIENCVDVAVTIIFLAVIATGITLISMALFPFLYPDLGVVGAAMTIATIFVYLRGVSRDKYEMTSFKDFPIYLKMPIMFVVLCLVYKFLLLYWATIISGIFSFVFFSEWLVALAVNAIKTAFIFLMSTIVSFGVQKFAAIMAAVGIPIAIIAILHYLPEEKQRRFYDALGSGLWYGLGAYLSLSALILAYWLIAYGGVIGTVFVVLFALYGAGAWYLFFYSSPYVKESRWITEHVSEIMDFREVLKNQWLLSLEKSEAANKMRFLYSLLRSIFDWEEKYYSEAIRWITPFISPEVIQKLESHQQSLKKVKSCRLRMMVIKVFISKNIDFGSAIVIAREEAAKQNEQKMLKDKKAEDLKKWIERRLKAIGKVLYVVFFIPIQFYKLIAAILRGVWFAIKKLCEYALTLRRLWELFNERCPYITEQKVLRFK